MIAELAIAASSISACQADTAFTTVFGRTERADWLEEAPTVTTALIRLFATPEGIDDYGPAQVWAPWVPHLAAAVNAECTVSIEDRIRQTFPQSPDLAVDIAWCESRHQLNAVGPDGGDLGLFQIRWPVHRRMLEANGITRDDLFTLDGNLAAARLVYDDAQRWHPRGPWGPWVCLGIVR